jgi:hypothetical protein
MVRAHSGYTALRPKGLSNSTLPSSAAGVGALAIELIHNSDDRHVAQAAVEGASWSAPPCPIGAIGGSIEHHHLAVDRGQGSEGVLGSNSGGPGVSSRLKASPSCSKLITAEETEMPRSRSIALQSERSRQPLSGRVNEMVTRIQASPADRALLSTRPRRARRAVTARIRSAQPL